MRGAIWRDLSMGGIAGRAGEGGLIGSGSQARKLAGDNGRFDSPSIPCRDCACNNRLLPRKCREGYRKMSSISHAALSDPGRTHDDNQDRWLANPEQGLYLVSDGMAEDISPQLVVDALPGLLETTL